MFIINKKGAFITNLDHKKEVFCSIENFEDTLFVGTISGSVLIYPTSSMMIGLTVDYPMKLKKELYQEKEKPQQTVTGGQIRRLQGPVVKSIKVKGNLMVVVDNDSLLICYARRTFSITNYIVSHQKKIRNIKWSQRNPKMCVSCCDDGLLMIWDYWSDRWLPRIIDISKSIIDSKIHHFIFDKTA